MTKRKGKRTTTRKQSTVKSQVASVTVESQPEAVIVQSTYVAPRDEFAERVIWLATFFEKLFHLK